MNPDLDLNGILNKIDQNASTDQLEKLKLLASSVVSISFKIIKDPSKITSDIYRAVFDVFEEERTAVAVFKRLLTGAGYSRRHIEELTQFTVASQPSPDLEKFYFYELLVKVSDRVGNGDYFWYLRNRIPRKLLDINRDRISTCVQLFKFLEQKRILDPSKATSSLTQLEGWLKDINRDDVAEIVRKRIDEIRGEC